MLDNHYRGDRCAHRVAVDLKVSKAIPLRGKERECLYRCDGKTNSCDDSIPLEDIEDFNRIFHKHVD